MHINRWGRIAILTALADFKPADSKEAEHIVERVIPQFQHANGSVVLSAIKVRLKRFFHTSKIILFLFLF